MTDNNFIPEGYEVPQGKSNYTKFEQGDNRFRILSKPIVGWEDWKDKKPFRYRMDEKPKTSFDPKKEVKHFWAFIVFNYQQKEIQILQVSQKSIQAAIKGYAQDEDWGNPFEYDINISRKGEGMDTEYTITPKPHKKVSAEILQAFKDKPCFLEALFSGADPFTPNGEITCLNDLTL